ncbi:MAG: hypothetical protein JWP31_1417 [Aeromicrobium sp.]|nr:hypothetical protein [Aeromicrobium sp.]
MRSRGTTTVLAAILAVTALAASAQADLVSNAHYYANQTPYGDPASTVVRTPPAGYELLFLETVARHGSRTLTSSGAEDRADAVWRTASSSGQLTTRGRQFDDDLHAFRGVERSIGYGLLSALGKQEWRGIGRRTADNYRRFLTDSAARGERIAMTTSPVLRTKQSARYLQLGLDDEIAGLNHASRTVDGDLVVPNGISRNGKAALASVWKRSSVRSAARHVLLRLYRPAYVDSLTDPVGKALDVYLLYSTAPGLKRETNVTFADYVPLADARRLAEAVDARNFYRYGPGVAGERSSFRNVEPVLDDFFTQLDRRIAGGRTAAVFRNGHGETTMPFAALIKAPGSQKQAPKGSPYSYGTNPWRGFVAGRPAGSIEWAAYRNAGGKVLVTMRHNEQPVRFAASCTPSAIGGGYFYRPAQLKRCLG